MWFVVKISLRKQSVNSVILIKMTDIQPVLTHSCTEWRLLAMPTLLLHIQACGYLLSQSYNLYVKPGDLRMQ